MLTSSNAQRGKRDASRPTVGWAAGLLLVLTGIATTFALAAEQPPQSPVRLVAAPSAPVSVARREASAASPSRENGTTSVADSQGRGALAKSADAIHANKILAPRSSSTPVSPQSADEAAIARAIQSITECQTRFMNVVDYTCTFFKRERVDGNLTPLHVMSMKVRTKPRSIYFKFQRPARGREAIYIAGRHNGKILAHDVGFNKLFAGTLELEPTSARAMEENRHPINEAGIGPLIETVAKRWSSELNPDDSRMTFRDDLLVGSRRCLMIESNHPNRRPHLLFHKVRVYIDQDLGLPVRFEAYDWPKLPHAEPELVEEYTYGDIKLNVGLEEIDFDVSNKEYAFGRF